ncbi:hypothetical protein Esti_000308 [Eimeria stiedai]
MDCRAGLSFQDALEGWRTIRKCDARGLAESADWLRELLGCARDAELSASAAAAALDEEDELKGLPSCCVPQALKVTSLLRRHDFFGASACMRNQQPHRCEDRQPQNALLLFAELFAELSLEQTRAVNWVAAGHRKEGEVVGLKPGRLQAAARRASEVLDVRAEEKSLDAFGWWLLATQQRQSESICALLEALRLCRCLACAWDDLTQQLAALLYAAGGPQGGAPGYASSSPTPPEQFVAFAAGGSAAADDEDAGNEGGMHVDAQSAHAEGSVSTREQPQQVPHTGGSSSSGCSGNAEESTHREQQQQQQQQQHREEQGWPQPGESWGVDERHRKAGSCVMPAAATAAAAATAIAEEAPGWPDSAAAAADAGDFSNAWKTGYASDAAAAVEMFAHQNKEATWVTPSFVSENLSVASLASFLSVLGLPDCGVYGRFFFARFCMRINRFSDAITHLLDLLEQFPECPMIVAQIAKCCCELGEHQRALDFFYALEQINPARLDFVSDFGRILASKNDVSALQHLAERCSYVAPAGAGALLVGALLARVQGGAEQSIDLLHAATALNPMSSEGWCLLGYAYMEAGDLLSAARAFAAATAAAPEAAAAHLGSGQTQALLHNWPTAERLYRTAVRCRPDLPIGWWHLGKAQKAQYRINEAFKSFQQCWLLAETTEAASECFACAWSLLLSGEVGLSTAALWAERLLEQFVASELELEGTASARALLRQLCADWGPSESRVDAALKKAPQGVLQAVALLAGYHSDKGDQQISKFYSEMLRDFGGTV